MPISAEEFEDDAFMQGQRSSAPSLPRELRIASCGQSYHSALVSSRADSRHPAGQAVGSFGKLLVIPGGPVGARRQSASGVGRSWKWKAIGTVPLPPSFSHGARSPLVVHTPRPFHPAPASSMRPSKPLA
jgi:hypothetical protein